MSLICFLNMLQLSYDKGGCNIMRFTRKMRRELKKAVNPLEELLIIIKQYFPKFHSLLDNLTDTRNQSYIT